MKNKHNKITILAGAILVVAIFALAFGAFPGSAEAQAYGYNDYSSCPYPTVYANGYYTCNHQPTYNPAPTYPTYPTYPPQPYYPPLTASCYANNSSVPVGSSVVWQATVSGGSGGYSYTWSGSDGLTGYGSSVAMTYYTQGTKIANLMVYSAGGQTASVTCSNSVNVYSYQPTTYYPQNYNYNYNASYPTYISQTVPPPIVNTTYVSSNASGLDIGCYADPANAVVNQPVTWNAEIVGGMAPYKVTWSGSDGLTGQSNTIVKYYQSSGSKSAIVTVTSADGRTGTRACTNAVTVRGGGSAVTPAPVQPAQPTPQVNQNNLGAASIFSLSGIPWGWVAILVILVLFATVMYLLFNKPKI